MGIKVVCINDRGYIYLTINKVYDAIDYGMGYYCIINYGIKVLYNKDRFMLLSDWREKMINSIIGGE